MPEYPLVPFVAGQDATATALNNAFNIERYAYQVADQSVLNSVTLVNSANLALSVAANGIYVLRTHIIYDANAVADFKFNFALPSGSFIRTASWLSNTAAATADATIFHDAQDVATYAAGGIAIGTFMTCKTMGCIFIGATAGTCQFQFAQNTANNTNASVLKAGSMMFLRKVA